MDEIKNIKKRDGSKVEFDIKKIADAIYRAAQVLDKSDYELSSYLSEQAESYLLRIRGENFPSEEEVNQICNQILFENLTFLEKIRYIKTIEIEHFEYFVKIRHGDITSDFFQHQVASRFCMFLERLLQFGSHSYMLLAKIAEVVGVITLIKTAWQIFSGGCALKYRLQDSCRGLIL